MECLLKCGGKKTAHWFPQRRPFQCFFPIGKTPRGSEGQSRSFNLKADFWIEKVGVEDDFAAKLWVIPSHITFFFGGKNQEFTQKVSSTYTFNSEGLKAPWPPVETFHKEPLRLGIILENCWYPWDVTLNNQPVNSPFYTAMCWVYRQNAWSVAWEIFFMRFWPGLCPCNRPGIPKKWWKPSVDFLVVCKNVLEFLTPKKLGEDDNMKPFWHVFFSNESFNHHLNHLVWIMCAFSIFQPSKKHHLLVLD